MFGVLRHVHVPWQTFLKEQFYIAVSDVPIPNGNAALAPVPREQPTPTHHQPPQQQQQQQQHKQIVHVGITERYFSG